MKKIGIIGAMEEEIEILKNKIKLVNTRKLAKMTFYEGFIDNKEIVLVRCGIGKVNAAVCTQILITEFKVGYIINTGVAGGIYEELEIGDIVISSEVIQHDFNAVGFGYKQGEIPRLDTYIFKADKKLIDLAIDATKEELGKKKSLIGRIVSGDIFIASPKIKTKLWENFNGYCAEMEGGAIGHTCYLNDVPFVILRAMSDKADGSAHENFNTFVAESSKNSAEIVEKIIKGI